MEDLQMGDYEPRTVMMQVACARQQQHKQHHALNALGTAQCPQPGRESSAN